MKKVDLQLVVFTLLLVAAFIEFSYGSAYLGALFGAASLAVLARLSRSLPSGRSDGRLLRKILGVAVVGGVLYYNLSRGSDIKTLDSFLMLFGASIALTGAGNSRIAELGRFTLYLSGIFLVLFSSAYVLPGMLGVKLPYYYGHYMVTLPVAEVLSSLGIYLEVVSMNLLYVAGKTNSLIGLDMACYGFYSMFLIISATIAYGITMRLPPRRVVPVLLVLALASYAANFLRVSTLITLAYYYGTETMLLVHSHLGWIFFGIILLPLMYFFLR
ncbi:MAG: archaeosortase C [Euryarchaeota archaeon]|nr:archaeosortase C [Euryarchaeota archaeon]